MVSTVQQRVSHPHLICHGKSSKRDRRQRSRRRSSLQSQELEQTRQIDSGQVPRLGEPSFDNAAQTAAPSPVPQPLQSTSRRRLVLHPMGGPPEGIDFTDAIISAVASELWKRFGGNDMVNWLEAERLVLNTFGSE